VGSYSVAEIDTIPTVRPITVVTDLRIVLDGRVPWYAYQTMDERGKALDRWARELEEFIRDHRSQDNVSLTVERVTEVQCDHCHRAWETYTEDGETYCASCGVTVAPPATPPAKPMDGIGLGIVAKGLGI
jgi:ribosomal protein L37AE/L43A